MFKENVLLPNLPDDFQGQKNFDLSINGLLKKLRKDVSDETISISQRIDYPVQNVKEIDNADYTILDNDGYTRFIFKNLTANHYLYYPTLADNPGREFEAVNTTGTYKVICTPEGAEKINDYNVTFEITEKGGTLKCLGLSTHWECTPNENCCIYRITSTSNITLTNTSATWQDALTLEVPAGIYNLEAEAVHYFRNTSFSTNIILYLGIGLTTGAVAPGIKQTENRSDWNADILERQHIFQKVEKKNYTISSPTTLRIKTRFDSDESATIHLLQCEATEPAILEARRIR